MKLLTDESARKTNFCVSFQLVPTFNKIMSWIGIGGLLGAAGKNDPQQLNVSPDLLLTRLEDTPLVEDRKKLLFQLKDIASNLSNISSTLSSLQLTQVNHIL